MIYLGYAMPDKQAIIADYQAEHAIGKTVVISHEHFPLLIDGADQVGYSDVIMYVTFYRLLQEIDAHTLVVLHEVLRVQNRYDLAYNCIRNYLNQTQHVLVFQTLPLIDTPEDFMILFDFATQSRWKRRPFDAGLILDNARVAAQPWPVDFRRIDVPTSAATQRRYDQEKAKLFAGLGARDPHTLPRNLYLLGGKDKLAWIEQRQPSLFGAGDGGPRQYVARNKRLGNGVLAYGEVQPGSGPYTVLELPHRFIDFSDFLVTAGQAASDVLVADLKVDHWYLDRYTAWKERIHATYTSLRG